MKKVWWTFLTLIALVVASSWFVSGLNETLPVKVLGFLQGQVSPKINVIGTFVFLTTMTLVVVAQILLMKRSRPSAGAPS